MKSYRNIPYGYRIENGIPVKHPLEAGVVKEIYSAYLDGCSYNTIATGFTSKNMEYHPGAPWNKNMVKRILENATYIGNSEYPPIVSHSLFECVQQKRNSKTAGYTPPPPYLKYLRGRVVCGQCGQPLKRDKRYTPTKWQCSSPDCTNIYVSEDSIVKAILDFIQLIQDGSIEIEKSSTATTADSRKLFQIQNELAREMGKLDVSVDAVCQLLLQEVSEAYVLCQGGFDTKYQRMIKAIDEYDTSTLDSSKLHSILSKLAIQPCSYTAVLATGQEIQLK